MNEIGKNETNKFTKKDALIQAAIKEFSVHSFEKASLNNILNKANVSKGVFYHHFTSKDELYLYVVGILFEKKKEFLMKYMTEEDKKGDIFQILKKNMFLGFKFAKLHPDIGDFSNLLMKERGNEVFVKVMTRYNVNTDVYVKSMIQNAISNGNIRDDISDEFATGMITYILNHVNEMLDTQSLEDYEKKVNDLFEFIEYGLKKR